MHAVIGAGLIVVVGVILRMGSFTKLVLQYIVAGSVLHFALAGIGVTDQTMELVEDVDSGQVPTSGLSIRLSSNCRSLLTR